MHKLLAKNNPERWRVVHDAQLNSLVISEHTLPIQDPTLCAVTCSNCRNGDQINIENRTFSVTTNQAIDEDIEGSIECAGNQVLEFIIKPDLAKRQLLVCSPTWVSTYAGAIQSYPICSGTKTKQFSPYTYNSACLVPNPDPDFTSPYGSWTDIDTCTTNGVVSSCTWTMNGVQTAFVTNGYQVTVNTCSPEIVFGYKYQIDTYYWEQTDGSYLHDYFYIKIGNTGCQWTAATTTTTMANLYYVNGAVTTSFPFDTILTQTPACGYQAFTYHAQMTDLSSLSLYGIAVTSTPALTIQTTQDPSILPLRLALQWWVVPTQYYSTTSTPWNPIYQDFSVTIYCKITSFTLDTTFSATYTVYVATSLVLDFPTTTQNPTCGYAVVTHYSVAGVVSAAYPWLQSTNSQFLFAPTLSSQVGTYAFVHSSRVSDTVGLATTVTSSFILNIICVLSSVTPITTLQPTYSVFVNSVLTITLPTYTQQPACNLTPVFTYTLDGVSSGSAIWLTTSSSTFTIAPTLATEHGVYAFSIEYAYTDGSGAVTTVSDSFSVSISACNIATYTVPTMLDLKLTYQGSAATYTWTEFLDSISVQTGIAESCGVWSYTWSSISLLNYASDITQTSLASNSFSFQWSAGTVNDFVLGQAYTNTINGALDGVWKTSANFNIFFFCEITSITRLNSLAASQSYLIGADPLIVSLSSYEQFPSCGYTLTQSYTINGVSQSASWLTLSLTEMIISTNRVTDLGIYSIEITMTYSDSTRFSYSDSQTITVVLTQLNTAPYFTAELTLRFEIQIGQAWEYELPAYLDDEGNEITVVVAKGAASGFLNYGQQKLQLYAGATTSAQLNQTYSISITLTDTYGLSSPTQIISLSFVAPAGQQTTSSSSETATTSRQSSNSTPAKSKTTKTSAQSQENAQFSFEGFNFTKPSPGIEPKTPVISIQSIKNTGLVTLAFSEVMVNCSAVFIQEATTIVNGLEVPVLQLSILPGYYTDRSKIGFNYTVLSYEKQKMTLQLDFDNPSVISRESADPENLKIVVNDQKYFFTAYGKTLNQSNSAIQRKLPQMYAGQMKGSVAAAFQGLQASSSYIMGGNLAVNVILSSSLQQLWSMVNTQQIIVLLPLFNIKLPQNAALFFGFLMQIASFDLLPTDKFYDDYFNIDQTQAINDNFDSLGFHSLFFLYNMGSLIIAWLSIPILALAIILLRCLKRCTKRVQRLHRWQCALEAWMFWNHPIRVFSESASIIYMCCLINLQYPSYDTSGDKLSTILAICFLVIAIVLPFSFTFIIYKNASQLDDPKVRDKFGAIYQGLSTERGTKLALQPFFFFIRRLLLAIVICFNLHLIVQILTVFLSFVVQITIIGYVKPFETKQATYQEYMNEALICVILYSMMTFSDFVPDVDTQIYVGYACCTLVAGHFIFNLGIMLLGGCRRLRMMCIRCKNRKKKVKPQLPQQQQKQKTQSEKAAATVVGESQNQTMHNSKQLLVIQEELELESIESEHQPEDKPNEVAIVKSEQEIDQQSESSSINNVLDELEAENQFRLNHLSQSFKAQENLIDQKLQTQVEKQAPLTQIEQMMQQRKLENRGNKTMERRRFMMQQAGSLQMHGSLLLNNSDVRGSTHKRHVSESQLR